MIELGRIETLLPNAFVPGSGLIREAIALAEDPHQRVELTVELAKALAAATNLPAAYALLEGVLAEPDGVEPSLLVHAEASLIGAGFGDLAASGLPERVAGALPGCTLASSKSQRCCARSGSPGQRRGWTRKRWLTWLGVASAARPCSRSTGRPGLAPCSRWSCPAIRRKRRPLPRPGSRTQGAEAPRRSL